MAKKKVKKSTAKKVKVQVLSPEKKGAKTVTREVTRVTPVPGGVRVQKLRITQKKKSLKSASPNPIKRFLGL